MSLIVVVVSDGGVVDGVVSGESCTCSGVVVCMELVVGCRVVVFSSSLLWSLCMVGL